MDIFKLPDLGEGLPDAEISEWFIKEGDSIKMDQPLVSMETAKAVVEVPSPQDGIIAKCYGKIGDIIKTGAPLVSFVSEQHSKPADKGTVVGNLEESSEVTEDNFSIGTNSSRRTRVKTTPTVKLLAKKLNVNLNDVIATGENSIITSEDVKNHADKTSILPAGYEPIKGVRRAMVNSMVKSHQEVVPVSIFDDADIASWPEKTDITARLIKAIIAGCKKEPALNAWFNKSHYARNCFDKVNLGIAMDSNDGLFVPVIHDAAQYSDIEIRKIINEYKISVQERSVSQDNLQGATITLSNFGKFAGRYASPIIVPPMVAILAVGRTYDGVISNNGVVETHRLLPLSLTFDHRAVTGGEATRFLGEVIKSLQD